jgi:hypothetical protein
LLPDRTSDAVFPWLLRHPEIDVVSRDRANGYTDAIKRALPHATQIADRFHLCLNLREHLQTLLDRRHTCLPYVEESSLQASTTSLPDDLAASSGEPAAEVSSTSSELPKGEEADQSVGLSQDEFLGEPIEPHADEDMCLNAVERKKKISRDKRYAETGSFLQCGLS